MIATYTPKVPTHVKLHEVLTKVLGERYNADAAVLALENLTSLPVCAPLPRNRAPECSFLDVPVPADFCRHLLPLILLSRPTGLAASWRCARF